MVYSENGKGTGNTLGVEDQNIGKIVDVQYKQDMQDALEVITKSKDNQKIIEEEKYIHDELVKEINEADTNEQNSICKSQPDFQYYLKILGNGKFKDDVNCNATYIRVAEKSYPGISLQPALLPAYHPSRFVYLCT